MASSQTVQVNEARRSIIFTDGHRLELSNVTSYNSSGTWLRIWSDEGFIIVNPKKILYHMIQNNPPTIDFDDVGAFNVAGV